MNFRLGSFGPSFLRPGLFGLGAFASGLFGRRPIKAGRGRTFTRRALWSGGVVLVLFALLAAAPLFLSGEFVRERVVAQLAEGTGATVRVSRSHVALYPRPRVVMENVRLGATHLGGAEAQVDRLVVDVALLPALGGRIVPTAMRAERPHLLLRRPIGSRGPAGSPGAVGSPQALAALLPSGPLPSPTLTVRDGRIDWQTGGRTLRVTALDATLSARGRGAGAKGSAVWNGEPVAFDTRLDDLAALASADGARDGERAPATGARFTLTSSPLSLAFEGSLDPAGRVNGRTTLETVSLERAVSWLGLGDAAPAVPASLSGDVSATLRDAAFRTVELRIGAARADGSLTFERRAANGAGKRVSVAGTLAFDDLDVAAAPLRRALDLSSPDARADLRLRHLTAIDLDLRLSAAHLQMAGTRLDDVAAILRTGPHKATLTVGDAVLGGGHLQGKASFASPHGTPRATLTLAAKDVPFDALPLPRGAPANGPASNEMGVLRPTGRGDVSLALATRGHTPGAMLAALRGRGSLDMREGRLDGFDLAVAARATLSGALPRQERVWTGATAFERLRTTFRLRDGVAALDGLRIRGRQWSTLLRGRVDLVRGAVALRGDIASAARRNTSGRPANGRPADAASGPLEPFRADGGFFVGGTLLTPLLVPVEAIEPPPETLGSG